MMEVAFQPGVAVPEHSHEHAQFFMCLQGGCVESYRGQARAYQRFTLGFLPCGHVHSVNYANIESRWFCVNVDPIKLERRSGHDRLSFVSLYSKATLLNALFLRLYREFRFPDEMSELAIEGLALEIIAEASRRTKPRDRIPPQWILEVKELLDENFSHQMRLKEIAGDVGMHPDRKSTRLNSSHVAL